MIKRILYIQHAGALCGSAMSLLFTMQALDKSRFEPIVALTRPCTALHDLYRSAGFETIPWPGIRTVEHTTAKHLMLHRPTDWMEGILLVRGATSSMARTRELVEAVRPDLVHLNSAVLALCARALHNSGLPVVWHIREHPVAGYAGLRLHWMRKGMEEWVAEVIFISQSDKNAWAVKRNGVVVHNFVDFAVFDRRRDGSDVRLHYGISPGSPVVLFTGGLLRIKGLFTLLEALALLKPRFQGLRCLMPGTLFPPRDSFVAGVARQVLPLLGSGTLGQQLQRTVTTLGLSDVCIRTPFQTEIAPWFAASDVVVFPSIRPHFARPIIEAGAMAKPVVASRLDGITELVSEGDTGLLVTPGDSRELADAIAVVLLDRALARSMGDKGYEKAAQSYSATSQIVKIQTIYDNLLPDRS